MRVKLLWLIGALARESGDGSLPVDVTARLMQREDFGVKVKVAYKLMAPTDKVELCIGCDAESTSSYIVTGNTCGGFPSGCATFMYKQSGAFYWTQESLGIQLRVDGGAWSEPVRFHVDKGVRGKMGAAVLQRVAVHDEL